MERPKKSMEKVTYSHPKKRDFDETQAIFRREYLFIYLFITQLRTSMNGGD